MSSRISRNNKRIIIVALIISTFVIASLFLPQFQVNAEEMLSAPAFPKVARASDTSLKLTWHKVAGASGYEVFRYDKAKKKYLNVKTINNGKTVKWTDKKLNTGIKYTYKIRAYKRNGLVKQVSDFTYIISAVPYDRNSTTVNAGSKLNGVSTMEIGLKQILKVNATAAPAKFGTAKKKKVVDPQIRVLPDASSHVNLSGKDSIVGNKVGTTNLYAVAHNGNVKKIKVDVVDYTRPASWVNLDEIRRAKEVLQNQSDDLKDVFSYLMQHNDLSGDFSVDANGKLINNNNYPLGEIEDALIRLLADSPLRASLYSAEGGAILRLWDFSIGTEYYDIVFSIQNDYTPEELAEMPGDLTVKIAKHWYVMYSRQPG